MTSAALILHVEPMVAVRHHAIIVSKAWGYTKSALLQRNRSRLRKLQADGTYGRPVEFFLALPHANPVDITLIDAAVSHVDRTLEYQRTWDGGKLVRTTWPDPRDTAIADLLGAQDVMTWARQQIYASGKSRPSQTLGQNLLAALRTTADHYLDDVLRHVVDVRDG